MAKEFGFMKEPFVCEKCFYYRLKESKLWNHGQCKRYPPQVMVTRNGDDWDTDTFFPLVDGLDWCGEWKGKLNG